SSLSLHHALPIGLSGYGAYLTDVLINIAVKLVGQRLDRVEGGKAMQTPPIVSPDAWEVARRDLLVKEKAHTRARDALAAELPRMPWRAVERSYAFEGPAGRGSRLDLFEGRRPLIV